MGEGDSFVVDNSDDAWKVQKYLSEWCELSKKFDIATGFFEIGSLLGLNGKWRNLEKIRILMGDEVSKRTRQAFEEGLRHISGKLNDSIEQEKEENDFLEGVPAIVESIRNSTIECRIYRKNTKLKLYNNSVSGVKKSCQLHEEIIGIVRSYIYSRKLYVLCISNRGL